jgi:hypothetical protein
MPRPSSSKDPAPLEDRLWARRDELEQAALARIAAISDPAIAPDPAYLAGLRAALAAALDYGLAAILAPTREPEPVPVQLLGQARLAARNGVSLEAVMRRYAAGHSLLADTLLDEAAAAGIGAAELKSALRALAERYDRVVVAVTEEYGREAEVDPHSSRRRRYALLRRLLAGERLDRRLLLAEPDEQAAWAWLGGRRRFECEELGFIASYPWPDGSALACGEPGQRLGGWRLSHRQAAAALPVAQRGPATVVHYADVALLASVLQDDLLDTSLRQAYLAPLEAERDGGRAAKDTLRAYFAAAGNTSSAAAALGVNRRTVASRLTAIEDCLDRPLLTSSAELEVALRLDQLETPSPRPSTRNRSGTPPG